MFRRRTSSAPQFSSLLHAPLKKITYSLIASRNCTHHALLSSNKLLYNKYNPATAGRSDQINVPARKTTNCVPPPRSCDTCPIIAHQLLRTQSEATNARSKAVKPKAMHHASRTNLWLVAPPRYGHLKSKLFRANTRCHRLASSFPRLCGA